MFQSICIVSTKGQHQEDFLKHELKDIHEVDRLLLNSELVGIAETRAVKKFLQQKPLASQYKVIVIPGNNLTLEAQQALLKTLEEPPEFARLFITVSHIDKLLPTIQSRSHIIFLKHTPTNELILFEKYAEFWKSVLQLPAGERLKQLADLPQERENLLGWLTETQSFFRSELIKSYKNNSPTLLQLPPTTYISICKNIHTAYVQLKANSSLKLTLDYLFLHLPKIKK